MEPTTIQVTAYLVLDVATPPLSLKKEAYGSVGLAGYHFKGRYTLMLNLRSGKY